MKVNSPSPTFTFGLRQIEGWSLPAVEFDNPARDPLCLAISGTIVNSVVNGENGRAKQRLWKVSVATKVKALRGHDAWNSSHEYAISLGLRFHPANHRGRTKLDVDNFIKPILDALAAGLFCENQTDPRDIGHWNCDDSNFNTLLVHRLPNADSRESEGIAVCVSARQ